MSGVLRTGLCRLQPVVSQNVVQKATFVYGKPMYRMPLWKKYAVFGAMMSACILPSMWITYNVPKYAGRE